MTRYGSRWNLYRTKQSPAGVYFRFRSKNKQDLTVGDRGIAALCEPLHWGPTAKVIEIDAGADMTVYTGYDITAPENRFLTEIFKGTNRTAAPARYCCTVPRPVVP